MYFQKLARVIERIENSKIPFIFFLISFFFIMGIRNFLETFSDKACFSSRCFIHFDSSFAWLASAFIVLFYIFNKGPIEKISRVVLAGFSIILLPPIADLILSGGKGFNMTYFLPGVHDNLLKLYFTFWGKYMGNGATPGIRIEVFLVMCATFFYSYQLKGKGLLRSSLFALSSYTLIFLFGMIPFIIDWIFKIFNLEFTFKSHTLTEFFFFSFLLTGPLILYFYCPKIFRELLKDIRPYRMFHYQLMGLIGFLIAPLFNPQVGSFILTQDNFFHITFLMASIFFACFFSLVSNNLVDLDIDKVSNPNRPLVKKTIPTEFYNKLGLCSLGLAGIFSALVGFRPFFIIFLFVGGYFIYSIPPFRLKRFPLFSKVILAFNSLILIFLGPFYFSEYASIPIGFCLGIVSALSFLLHFIDIKDSLGDRVHKIKTIPIRLGDKLGRELIGLFFIIIYPLWVPFLMTYFPVKLWSIIPLTLLGLGQYYFINKKTYKEGPIFILNFIGIFFMVFHIYMNLSTAV